MPERAHGTINGYTHWGCRCAACTAASTAYKRRSLDRLSSIDVPPRVHGTKNGYSAYGCRCAACTGANSLAVAEQRARRKARSEQSVGGPGET